MKRLLFLTCLIGFLFLFFVFQSFKPISGTDNNQQLLVNASMFNLGYTQEKIYLHLDRPSYWANDDIWFKAYLKNSPIPDCNLYVELINSAGDVIYKRILWAQNGLAYGDIHLADTVSSGVYQIRAYTNWMRNFDNNWFYHKDMVIWNLRDKPVESEANSLRPNDIDFQFFPEGGTFIAGRKNRVAFKAIDRNGKGIDINGEIIDDLGNKIINFNSRFKGMGNFLIEPLEGRRYKARITVGEDINMGIYLPVVQSDGISLSIDSYNSDQIRIRISSAVRNSVNNPDSTYMLVGRSNGAICFQKEIVHDANTCNLEIPKSEFPTGIIQFTLFGQDMIPHCERLVFINNHDYINVEIIPDKFDYHTRERVQLDVSTFNGKGAPCITNLSMSVFNPDTQLSTQDYPNNILSQFLLSSELKGSIEDPSYYFKDDSLSTLTALDNLMLTHGYRYFGWEEIRDNKFPDIIYQPEESLQLKGKVTSSILGKPVAGAKVTMIILKSLLGYYLQTTDSLGHFVFPNLYFNDTVYFSLQAINQKGHRNTWIDLDNKSFTSPKSRILPDTYMYNKENPSITTTYLSELSNELISKKWHLSDTILIGDINVVAKKMKKGDGHVRMYVDADYVFDMSKQDDIYGNIFDMIDGRVPGVKFDPIEEEFYIRGQKPAALYLDGSPTSYDFLSSFSSSTFDKIEVLKWVPFIPNGANGAIFFYTKRGTRFENAPTDALGMKGGRIIGYSVIRKFYSPKYKPNEHPEIRNDYRSTIYWNPIVRTDLRGQTQVDFYNSDQTGEVQVVVEGVAADGKICRGVYKYNVVPK